MLAGAEGVVRAAPLLSDWRRAAVEDPYGGRSLPGWRPLCCAEWGPHAARQRCCAVRHGEQDPELGC